MDANTVESAEHQRQYYRSSEAGAKLKTGQQVLLHNPVRGKLDPRWTGPWVIIGLRGLSTVLLKVGSSTRAVHINRVRPLLTGDVCDQTVSSDWTPPLFRHEEGAATFTPMDQEEQHNIPPTVGPPTVSSGGEVPRESPQEPELALSAPPVPLTTRSGRQVKPVQCYGWT